MRVSRGRSPQSEMAQLLRLPGRSTSPTSYFSFDVPGSLRASTPATILVTSARSKRLPRTWSSRRSSSLTPT